MIIPARESIAPSPRTLLYNNTLLYVPTTTPWRTTTAECDESTALDASSSTTQQCCVVYAYNINLEYTSRIRMIFILTFLFAATATATAATTEFSTKAERFKDIKKIR